MIPHSRTDLCILDASGLSVDNAPRPEHRQVVKAHLCKADVKLRNAIEAKQRQISELEEKAAGLRTANARL